MTFEQRLDTIESNVEKEIRAVKDIAENLLRTATTSNDLMTLQQQRHNNSSERSV